VHSAVHQDHSVLFAENISVGLKACLNFWKCRRNWIQNSGVRSQNDVNCGKCLQYPEKTFWIL